MTGPADLANVPVYVIDDDSAVLKSTIFLLGAFGFECETFSTAAEFLARVDALAPGCVLTDLRMPQMDGWTLLSKLRERSIGWPVVLMSSDNGPELSARAEGAGFSSYVKKPVEGAALVAAVRRALTGKEGAEA